MNTPLIAILCILISTFKLTGQTIERDVKSNLFSIALGKSAFTIREAGLSMGRSLVWIPDVEIKAYLKRSVFGANYSHYRSVYSTGFQKGKVEERKYQFYEATYQRNALISRSTSCYFGMGLSCRTRFERIFSALVMHGSGWYEVRSDARESVGVGPVFNATLRQDITRKLFLDLKVAYSYYIKEQDIGRISVNIGYYIKP